MIIQQIPIQILKALVAIDFSNFYKLSQALHHLEYIHAETIKNQRNLQRYQNENNNDQSKISTNKETALMSKIRILKS